MSAIIMAIAASAATHSITIDHHGSPVQAVYSAHTDISMRTIGAATPNRTEQRRCLWTASIKVERNLSGSPALTRTVAHDERLSGSRHGPCNEGKRQAIAQEINRQDKAIRTHLLEVAEQDHPRLLAELEAVRSLASN